MAQYNVAEPFLASVRAHPDKTAVVFDGREITMMMFVRSSVSTFTLPWTMPFSAIWPKMRLWRGSTSSSYMAGETSEATGSAT